MREDYRVAANNREILKNGKSDRRISPASAYQCAGLLGDRSYPWPIAEVRLRFSSAWQ